MDRGHQFVRLDGDDGYRADRAAVGGMPFAPEAREGEGLARLEEDEVRDFDLRPRLGLPLVEAVRGDETALVFERAAEGGLFGERLAARVDEAVAQGRVLRPGWDQSPDEKIGRVPAVVGDGEDGLRRRDVIARRELRGEGIAFERRAQVGGINGEGEASAHGVSPKKPLLGRLL